MWHVSIIRGPIKAGRGGKKGLLSICRVLRGGHRGSDQSPTPPCSVEQQPVKEALMQAAAFSAKLVSVCVFVSAHDGVFSQGASLSFRFPGFADRCKVGTGRHAQRETH